MQGTICLLGADGTWAQTPVLIVGIIPRQLPGSACYRWNENTRARVGLSIRRKITFIMMTPFTKNMCARCSSKVEVHYLTARSTRCHLCVRRCACNTSTNKIFHTLCSTTLCSFRERPDRDSAMWKQEAVRVWTTPLWGRRGCFPGTTKEHHPASPR